MPSLTCTEGEVRWVLAVVWLALRKRRRSCAGGHVQRCLCALARVAANSGECRGRAARMRESFRRIKIKSESESER